MLEKLKIESLQEFRQLNRKAIAFYKNIVQVESAEEVCKPAIVEWLYHELINDPKRGVELLGQYFDQAEAQYNVGLCEELMGVTNDLESGTTSQIHLWISYYLGKYHYLKNDLQNCVRLFQHILESATDLKLLGLTHKSLGTTFFRLHALHSSKL